MKQQPEQKIDWAWVLEANRQNPFSDEELEQMGITRDELDWNAGRAKAGQ